MSLDRSDPLQPILLGRDAGEARWWGDSLAIIKASAETSAGRIAVIDNYGVEGAAPPLHVHHNEGEGFYVIDGHAYHLGRWQSHRCVSRCIRVLDMTYTRVGGGTSREEGSRW